MARRGARRRGGGRRLVDALEQLTAAVPAFLSPSPVPLPDPRGLAPETVALPRDALFGPVEVVRIQDAVGRIGAEQVTPYPPGIPVIVPGERISAEVIDYLETGLDAGMVLPDPADPSLDTLRVTARS